ncbi:MAG: porin [Acidobacteria bacterium]|nr:MAG: porin [Acidobacteriota bacterium]
MRTGGRIARTNSLLLVMIVMSFADRFAMGQVPAALPEESGSSAQSTWQYGGFIDAGYMHDFNYPANHLFRSRGTTFHVNEADLNMTALYLRKTPSDSSRWGTEITLQAGKDSEVFGFSATAPNLDGAKWLRHLGPTDISYLAPIGKGLTIQGGIFSSFIGYDSLYAKDNFNYTRPWGADFTPYLMLGVNAQYPLTTRLTGTLFVISGYWHLAHANDVPSSGGQVAYKPNERLSMKQTVLYGPHHSGTSLQFWRFLSDSIVEWKRDPATVAFEYQVSEEKVAVAGNPRALWMSAQMPMHWIVDKHWSATVRPEVAWDRNGRWTGFSQTVKAVTNTIEYRIPYRQANVIVRLEHRWDDSRGPGGGFFNDGDVRPGVPGLKPAQHLLALGVILTFDSSFHHH